MPSAFMGVGMDSPLFLMLLLGLHDVAAGRYSFSFLFLSADSLALALAFTATLLYALQPYGTLSLMAILPGVGGNARVGVQDG